MFVRFRSTARRLELALAETRRIDGKVKQEHVASLGSIPLPLTVAGRIAFWAQLHARLARLANRISSEDHSKILGAVHARVPIPTAAEQRELQLENAKKDTGFWETLHGMHTAAIEQRKVVIAGAEKLNAENAAEKVGAEAHLEAARERIARIERGETVSGFGKPMSRKDFVKAIGGPAVARRCERLAELYAIGGDAAEKQLVDEHRRLSSRTDKTALRTVRKRYGLD
jgi:hypothetical protein